LRAERRALVDLARPALPDLRAVGQCAAVVPAAGHGAAIAGHAVLPEPAGVPRICAVGLDLTRLAAVEAFLEALLVEPSVSTASR
jgi:hypothetical protein